MIYLLLAVAFYLAIGIALTRWLQRKTTFLRARLTDYAFGALSMPVISLVSLLCATLNTVWTALLILLAFDPEDASPARNRTATDLGAHNGL